MMLCVHCQGIGIRKQKQLVVLLKLNTFKSKLLKLLTQFINLVPPHNTLLQQPSVTVAVDCLFRVVSSESLMVNKAFLC